MKILFLFGVCLLAASSSQASSNFLGLAVAERSSQAASEPAASPAQRVLYIAYDGGYIEAGLPVAGVEPPSTRSIEMALRDSLRAAGFETAAGGMRPSLALVFNWGYIHREFRNRLAVTPNVQARISLVSTTRTFERTIEFLRDGKDANAGYLSYDLRNALQLARGGRYFVVVSAYDFSDLTRGAATLLWRVKLSAEDTSGDLREVLPSLISNGGPYIGKSLHAPVSFSVSLRDDHSDVQSAEPFPSVEATKLVHPDVIYQLVRGEHMLYSGNDEALDDATRMELDAGNKISPQVGIPISRALADRMVAYRRARTALDLALIAKIKPQNTVEGRRASIDQFNRENAVQITALNRESESIRGELAAASEASPYHPSDQSVATLIRQFNELDLDSLSSDLPMNQR